MIFNNINLLEIIFTLFAVFAWSRAYLRFREKKIASKDLVLWTVVWAAMVVIMFIPGKADYIARKFGIREGNDLVFFVAIAALFYAMYRVYVKLGEIDKHITDLVRKDALHEHRKK